MIQDILPRQLDLCFHKRQPQKSDYVVVFREGRALLKNVENHYMLPTLEQLAVYNYAGNFTYLFSIDEAGFFLAENSLDETAGLSYQDVQVFREMQPSWLAFAGVTAVHLAFWYDKNKYCGRCASPMSPSTTERAMVCPSCGLINYPNIAPVVIVGVIDGDRLLMTRYARGIYRNLALVAGFTEIGETLEDTVRREVQEEVGLKVKNIRYYKSQPWAFSQSLLMGFFADLDGSPEVCVDQDELSEAIWVPRNEIPPGDSNISLTYTMIETFRDNRHPA